MTDYFLKAADRAAFEAACPWMGEDGVVTDGVDYALTVIGVLSYGAQFDVNGTLTAPPTVVPGWHVNVRLRDGCPLPASLDAFVVPPPQYPKRIFAD